MSILFEETALKGMLLRNRFVRSATYESMATLDGECTEDLVEFTAELARGGVGLIITGHAYVHRSGRARLHQTAIDRDDVIAGLRKLTERVHRYGGRVALQISHAGGHTRTELTSQPLLAPSAFRNIHGESAREMSPEEIEQVGSALVSAGERAREAGFDAIQLHSAHGYLLNQFLSPFWNKRRDEYGGSIENRARMLLDVCSRLRNRLGSDFPVMVKLSSEDFIEGGLTLDESAWVAERLSRAGVAAVEVSGGSRHAGSNIPARPGVSRREDEAYFARNAKRIRAASQLPTMLVGGIRSFDLAEEMVAAGAADYISMCRPFIRDPHLVNRWKSGEKSRARCISDNLCFTRINSGLPLACVVEEREKAARPSSRK